MNRIILIGNGFDLAHGLKTSYNHFLEWVKNHKIIQNPDDYFEYILLRNTDPFFGTDKPKSSSFFKRYYKTSTSLERFISYCSKCQFVYKNKFLEHLIQKTTLQNWVDIEEEYFKKLYECAKHNNTNRLKKLHQDFDQIKNDLEEYLCGDSKGIASAPKDYLKKCTDNQSSNLNEILFLSFNYTSLEKDYETSNTQTIHIHGELKNDKNPIIFGYGNENAKQYKEIEEINNNDLLINMKFILYENTTNHKRLDDFVEKGEYEVFVLGHSCGLSDGTLLSMLFNHKNCLSIKPFYHEWENGTDNYLDIRTNISRHFPDKNIFHKKVINKELCCELK